MSVTLLRYPAGLINPHHTHPCGHGMYVLEGKLVTHRGVFGPGTFVWFPEGDAMQHGASAEGDMTALFITNKPFSVGLRNGRFLNQGFAAQTTRRLINSVGRPLTVSS